MDSFSTNIIQRVFCWVRDRNDLRLSGRDTALGRHPQFALSKITCSTIPTNSLELFHLFKEKLNQQFLKMHASMLRL